MIEIRIHGIEDGLHDVSLSVPSGNVKGMFPEFFGEVVVEGSLRKLGNRFTFTGEARCKARLVCDRTLKEFDQLITAEISASYLADNTLLREKEMAGEDSDAYEVNIIPEDDQYIDLSEEVAESLAVGLPMKRIAPDVEDKELEELYPGHAAGSEKNNEDETDERWAPLRDLKLN